MEFALKSSNVATPDGVRDAFIIIKNGRIKKISDCPESVDCEVEDFGKKFILPGLVDTHVHINEPGHTEWEGFESATKSAAAGGITTLIDMPLNSIPVTTSAASFKKKIDSAKNKLFVDCGFYGGIIPGNAGNLEELIQNGVMGLKAFLIHSGLNDFPNVTEADLRIAFEKIKSFEKAADIPLLFHAELDPVNDNSFSKKKYSEANYRTFLESRPKEFENKAIELLINLCREFKNHIHIVHLSSSDGIEMIAKAKAEGLKVTTETCPHYLFFSSDKISDNDTRFKCTPPIRDNENREKLWSGIRSGVIDFIVSDHSPCSPELKFLEEGDFEKAWGGISSLQLGLSIVMTEAEKHGLQLKDVSELMSTKPAEFAGLGNIKGKIKTGYDADLVVFDPDKKNITDVSKLFHKNKPIPYEGLELKGEVVCTYLRGEKIFENGKILNGPKGKIILRNEV